MPALKTPGGLTADRRTWARPSTAAWACSPSSRRCRSCWPPFSLRHARRASLAAIVGSLAVGLVALRPDSLAASAISTGWPLPALVALVFAVCFGIPSWLLSQSRRHSHRHVARLTARRLLRPEERRLGIGSWRSPPASRRSARRSNIALVSDSTRFVRCTISSSRVTKRVRAGDDPAWPPARKAWDAHTAGARLRLDGCSPSMAAGAAYADPDGQPVARRARSPKSPNLLTAPWPDIPNGVARARARLRLVLAAALGLSFGRQSRWARLGVVVSGALGMAFALQGLRRHPRADPRQAGACACRCSRIALHRRSW